MSLRNDLNAWVESGKLGIGYVATFAASVMTFLSMEGMAWAHGVSLPFQVELFLWLTMVASVMLGLVHALRRNVNWGRVMGPGKVHGPNGPQFADGPLFYKYMSDSEVDELVLKETTLPPPKRDLIGEAMRKVDAEFAPKQLLDRAQEQLRKEAAQKGLTLGEPEEECPTSPWKPQPEAIQNLPQRGTFQSSSFSGPKVKKPRQRS